MGELSSSRFHPDKSDTAFVIIDFQDKLLAAMGEDVRKKASKNIVLLIHLTKLMQLPIIITEQYPRGLGKTTSELIQELGELYQPIEKLTFSCCAHPTFVAKIEGLRARHLVLTGVEAHICVLQTALDLLADSYEVSVVSDAVCSRHESDRATALRMVEQAGGVVTSTEIMIFQLLKQSHTPEFKTMSSLLKQQ